MIAAAVVLVQAHRGTWRAVQDAKEDESKRAKAELRYQYLRYRRRVQTSAMLGIVGAMLLAGPFLPRRPMAFSLFVGVLLIVVVWIGLLAVADMVATGVHYGRLRHDVAAKQAELEIKARRHRSTEGNGKADKGVEL